MGCARLRSVSTAILILAQVSTCVLILLPGALAENEHFVKVNVHEGKALMENETSMLLLDVQDREDYLKGHIRNAYSIPLWELENRVRELDNGSPVLVYGSNEYQSTTAGGILHENGFKTIYAMCCGMRGWTAADYPVYVKYSSLQSALDATAEGSTILVSSGTYDGPIAVPRSVTLLGENGTNTVIDGHGQTVCLNITSSDCSISNFTFSNASTGLILHGSDDIVIDDCILKEVTTGMILRRSNRISLNRNEFDSCGLILEGDELEDWNSHDIQPDNRVNGADLLYLKDAQGLSVDGIHGQIIMANCRNITLDKASIFGSTAGVIMGFSDSNRITKCTISSNGQEGLLAYNSRKNTIENNTMEMNGRAGIHLKDSSNNTVRWNMIKDNAYYGLMLEEGMGNVIGNNSLVRNNGGGVQAGDSGEGTRWDDGTSGNYWGDYEKRYPEAAIIDHTWDTPYEIAGPVGAKDHRPLVRPSVLDPERPMADAGPDVKVDQHETVDFDGSQSLDTDAIVNYTWSFPEEKEEIRLFGPKPSRVFDAAGLFNVVLNVTNTKGNTHEDSMLVTVIDKETPQADAGPDILLDQNDSALLDASGSSDNTAPVEYIWIFHYNGTRVELKGIEADYRFREAGNYPVTLTVMDAEGNIGTDLLTVTVRDTTPPVAVPMEVSMEAAQGEQLIFNGSLSRDNVGIVNYTWNIRGENLNATLLGKLSQFLFTSPGVFEIILEVEDAAGNRALAEIVVKIKDVYPPVCAAGDDIRIRENGMARFDGRNSSDNVGIVNYTWEFEYNEDQSSLYGPEPSFVFHIPGNYSVLLKVRDAAGNQDIDRVYVYVEGEPKVDGELGLIEIIMLVIILVIILLIVVFLLVRRASRKGLDEGAEQSREEIKMDHPDEEIKHDKKEIQDRPKL